MKKDDAPAFANKFLPTSSKERQEEQQRQAKKAKEREAATKKEVKET